MQVLQGFVCKALTSTPFTHVVISQEVMNALVDAQLARTRLAHVGPS